jgi:hypothetical protein
MNKRRTAQRVTGCGAPHSGSAVTQRRETDARSPYIGNPLADLPRGERWCVSLRIPFIAPSPAVY